MSRKVNTKKRGLGRRAPGKLLRVSAADGFDFAERLEELNEELEALNLEAQVLEGQIATSVGELLSAV